MAIATAFTREQRNPCSFVRSFRRRLHAGLRGGCQADSIDPCSGLAQGSQACENLNAIYGRFVNDSPWKKEERREQARAIALSLRSNGLFYVFPLSTGVATTFEEKIYFKNENVPVAMTTP